MGVNAHTCAGTRKHFNVKDNTLTTKYETHASFSFHFHFSFTVHNAVENVTTAKCDIDVLKVCQNLFDQPSYLSVISVKGRRSIKARVADLERNKVWRTFVVETFAAGAHHVKSAGVGGVKVL